MNSLSVSTQGRASRQLVGIDFSPAPKKAKFMIVRLLSRGRARTDTSVTSPDSHREVFETNASGQAELWLKQSAKY